MTISVALCTYNGMPHLQKQLGSIFRQHRPVNEIVICDDGSDDGSWEYLQNLEISENIQLVIVRNSSRLGTRMNFEKAVQACKGDIIFLADQDDVWFPKKTEAIHQFFQDHISAEAVFTNAEIINEDNVVEPGSIWENFGFSNSGAGIDDRVEFLLYQLLNPGLVTGATMAFKREALLEAIPFFTPQHYWHDYWLGVYFSAKKSLYAVAGKLMQYRQHAAQQTGAALSNLQMHTLYRLAYQAETSDDPEIAAPLMEHLAHAVTRFYLFEPVIKTLDYTNSVHSALIERLNQQKRIVLQQMPLLKRKIKLFKHWIHGGEFLRISWRDVVTI